MENKFEFDIGGIFGDFKQEQSPLELKNTSEIKVDEEVVETPTEDPVDPLEENETNEEEKEVQSSTVVNNESTEDSEKEEEEEEELEYSYKNIAAHLADQGILDFEDTDDIEDNIDVLETAVLNTVKNMVSEYKESIPEVGKQFLDFLEKGGNPEDFLKVVEKPLDFKNLDLENEDTQKRVIKELLKLQDYSDEEIEEHIQDYEDGLILDKRAKTAAKRLEQHYEKQAENLIKSQEEERIKKENEFNDYVNSIKTTINKSENLAGLSISKSDKQEFEKYLLSRDREGKTQYQKEYESNPVQTQLELAYLKFKKYDFSKAIKEGKTAEAKRVRNLVKNTDKVKSTRSNVDNNNGKSHVDLSAFKTIF